MVELLLRSYHCFLSGEVKEKGLHSGLTVVQMVQQVSLPTFNYWKCHTGCVNVIFIHSMLWWNIMGLIEMMRIIYFFISLMFMTENKSPPPLSSLMLLAQHIHSGEIPWQVMTLFIGTVCRLFISAQPEHWGSSCVDRRLQHHHFPQSGPDCTKFNRRTAKWCALIFIRFQSRKFKCFQAKFMWMRCN